ncbi:AMP-dependent synthetase/ligase [Streptomyces jeddahensis]|uniref:Acyl-CoA synthetase n=1 Tax=Streptomyces jeddahensis TaxID=1716141 RepID=A0A177HYY1_9ACTN|nr:AMP-dependent synthetase/ligase [Streptomyces jeddahensis]OAH15920.1 long-chain-fatty-acid--CoA ligase FadD15 [Streptomyces jeddahensis]
MQEVSLPRLVEPLRSGGLADSVFQVAEQTPEFVQFSRRSERQPDEWYPVTAAEFRDEVLAAAKGFIASGIRFGDRVALMSRTRYEWTLLTYALWAIGARVVPVYPTSSSEQVRWILDDTQAAAIVVEHEDHAMTVGAICGSVPRLAHMWQLDSGGVRRLVEAGQDVPDDAVTRRRAAVQPQHIAAIPYTSGTTGRPRGCLLTHANLAAECDTLIAGWRELTAEPGEEPSILTFLPVAHCYGIMVVVSCLRGGVRLGHQPDMTPAALLAALDSFRPTFLFAVPYIFEKIFQRARLAAAEAGKLAVFDKAADVAARYAEALERQAFGKGHGPGPALRMQHALYEHAVYARIRAVLGGRVRYAVSGGSTLRRRLGLFFAGAGITVYEGYGLTETSAAVTAQPVHRVRFGTVGKPMPGNTVHIALDGEVWVRGDVVFLGYLNNREATDQVLRDGWLATGDVGYLDADGYLVITGRKKDIIITSGGKSVAPLVLEEQLREDPMVSQCLVVGDNQPYVAALVTLDPQAVANWRKLMGKPQASPEAMTDDDDLRALIQRTVSRVNTGVSRAESIRAFRILPQEFSASNGLMTPSLKLRRSAIVSAFKREIDDLYARNR